MAKTFTPVTYTNDSGQRLNATNMNRIETGIDTVDTRAAALELGISSSVTVTYAATVTINASLGRRFKITATGDLTLAPPSSPTDGQQILVSILASGADRVLTISGSILLTTGLVPSVTITSGKRWIGGLVYDTDLTAWLLIASTQQS